MQKIDRFAVDCYGIPSVVLMENAGSGAAREILKMLKRIKSPRVAIICGPGNNGGDGFVVARHLMIHGIFPEVFVLVPGAKLKGDAALNYHILKQTKCAVKFIVPNAAALKKADILVDAIFGIGLARDIEGKFRKVIEDINRYARKVVSLDIPSGLDGTTGKINGVVVNATKTITFHLKKKGLMKHDGKKASGNIVVAHIGFRPDSVGL